MHNFIVIVTVTSSKCDITYATKREYRDGCTYIIYLLCVHNNIIYDLIYSWIARLSMHILFTAKCFPHKLKYLHTSRFHEAFSLDEISLKPGAPRLIELQMFQGRQNWSWISQGVLGSNFIAVPGNPGGRAIQLYMTYNLLLIAKKDIFQHSTSQIPNWTTSF